MDFSPTEQSILVDLVVFGADKAENISNRTGYHRNSISRSISPLVEQGHLRNKGGGVYELTQAGREAGRGLVVAGVNPYQ
jgi:predicted transcriptional regulator